VVATRNRADRCRRLLWALAEQTLGTDAFEVIPVNDCSDDDTAAVLASLVEKLPYRLRPQQTAANRGPGPARNLGWSKATAPIVAFTDDDCVPDPGWLEAGYAKIESDPALGVVQGRTRPADINALFTDRWNHCVIIDGPNAYFETCNIFYRRSALEDSGGFGEDYHWWRAWWCEDSFAGWGALEAGWSQGFAPEAVVTHDVERRSMRWWLTTSLSQCNEVSLATRFPAYRRKTFWKSWSPRPYDAAFVIGSLGLVAGIRWRPCLLLALPYMWLRRPSIRQSAFLQRCLETVAVDSARTVGNVYGAIRNRTVII
jgi:GT2 family glycosyltransferase